MVRTQYIVQYTLGVDQGSWFNYLHDTSPLARHAGEEVKARDSSPVSTVSNTPYPATPHPPELGVATHENPLASMSLLGSQFQG